VFPKGKGLPLHNPTSLWELDGRNNGGRSDGMIPEVIAFPHLDHPAVQVKCSACEMMRQHVDQCEKYKCCFAYQRRGHEQRLKDEAARRKEG
jgi:hypothetical protein